MTDYTTQHAERNRTDETARHAKVAAIVAALNMRNGGKAGVLVSPPEEAWSVVEPSEHQYPCYYFVLTRADGASFNLHWDDRKGRISTGCEWPLDGSDWYRDDSVSNISFATTRTPEAIAGDIERRFLPEYLPALAKMQARKADADDKQGKAIALCVRLASTLGKPASPQQVRDDIRQRSRGYSLTNYERGFDLTVQTYGHVKFEVDTYDPQRALRIAEFLMTLEPEER